MSEPDDVPELSPEVRAFLNQHAATGEPTPEALARTGARVVAAVQAPTPLAQARARTGRRTPSVVR